MENIQARASVCPLYHCFEIFGKKRSLHIFRSIGQEYATFSALMRRLPQINSKVLSERLDLLIEEGLIERIVSQTKPLKVTYQLSQHGQKLHSELAKLNIWILQNPLNKEEK